MLAINWDAIGQVVLAGVLVGLVAKLLGLISTGTKKGFKNEVRDAVQLVLDEREKSVKDLAEDIRLGQRRELDQIWAAISDLRRRER